MPIPHNSYYKYEPFEYQHSLKTFVDGEALDTPDFMMVGLVLGFPMGEELEALDRIEDKIDALR